MAEFTQFLDSFDPDPTTKGKQFEHFVKRFLKKDPGWSTQVDKIWLWNDWPGRWGPDCGIDLVFQHSNGQVWAVQANAVGMALIFPLSRLNSQLRFDDKEIPQMGHRYKDEII